MLTILVTELGLLVLEFFLSDEPEVINSEPLIVVLACGNLLFLDRSPERTTFVPHSLLVLIVVVVIDGVGSR